MEVGAIEKVFNYYFSPRFDDELKQALRQFFNQKDLERIGKAGGPKGRDEEIFNEWFLFDFKLTNGRTPLENFYETNPYNLKMVRQQVYKDLQENDFGLYEVKEVRLGEGLTLENLQTGRIYQVREYAATFGLKRGQIFSARVGKVGDHYELVGSNSCFGPVKLNKTLKKSFQEMKEKLNPKILHHYLFKQQDSADYPSEPLTYEEAEKNFNSFLRKHNLDKFVSAGLVKEWIFRHSGKAEPMVELSMLTGLLGSKRKFNPKVLGELAECFSSFYNFCPQKKLGGKSPLSKQEKHRLKGIPGDPKMSLTEFNLFGWTKNYNKALAYVKRTKFREAISELDEVFKYLLKHKTVFTEIYRIFANKGMQHLSVGETVLGLKLLETAHKLNPNYDFARNVLKQYHKGKYKYLMMFGALKTLQEGFPKRGRIGRSVKKDPAIVYYDYLKRFKINFKTDKLTVSKVNNLNLKDLAKKEIKHLKKIRKK